MRNPCLYRYAAAVPRSPDGQQLRTGKALRRSRQEIALHFRPAAHQPFEHEAAADVLRFSLDPDRIGLEINLNGAGDPFDLERAMLRADFAEQKLPPYSRLLAEILGGEPTLSIRGDEAEESWRIVESILAAWDADLVPIEEYPAALTDPVTDEAAELAGTSSSYRCAAIEEFPYCPHR